MEEICRMKVSAPDRNALCRFGRGNKDQFSAVNLRRNFCKRPDAGFTYLGLLILLAILGIVSAAALQMGVVTHRRVAEEALLDVGREFSLALASYQQATPSGQPDEPLRLEDLLKDPRFPGTVRHLRKLYHDPITGQPEWGLQRSEESKRIVGVFSLSDAKPIKIANFDLRFQDFAGKSSYREWVFTGTQTGSVSTGGPKFTSPRDLMGDPPDIPVTDSPRAPRGTSPLDLLD
jgi:type II secretory pathway pseudopilin PulG